DIVRDRRLRDVACAGDLGVDFGNLSEPDTRAGHFGLGIGIVDRFVRADILVSFDRQNSGVWRNVLALCWNMSHRVRLRFLPRARKAVVVTFGGGARDDETFAPDGQDNIPHMLTELAPRSTFFTQVINRGILGHYVATASLATGVYETFNNFAKVSPDHPTVF